jgi:hypothetical protein
MVKIEKLINLTVELMKSNNITDLLILKEPCSNPKSCWGQLCYQLYDEFNKIKSLNIYNMWVKNTSNYKLRVLNCLNDQGEY